MIANFLPVAGDFLNLRVCRVFRGSVFFGVRDVLGDIRDEDDYLAASRAAEPVLGFGFHAAAVGRFRRREHNEMNGAIEGSIAPFISLCSRLRKRPTAAAWKPKPSTGSAAREAAR